MDSMERLARRTFSQTPHDKKGSGGGSCFVMDPATGVRGVPNCVFLEEKIEIQPVEYRLNSCGHHASMDCGPKAPDIYRIVMTGSSFAEGADVPIEKTFGTLLPAELSRQTGRKVELYNEAMSFRGPLNVGARFNEILAAQPSAILWILTPHDIEDVWLGYDPQETLSFAERVRAQVKQASTKRPLPDAALDMLRISRASLATLWGKTASGVLMMHFLYRNPIEYVKFYLMGGVSTRFLQERPDPEWQYYLRQFNNSAAYVEDQAKAAGVPLVAVLVPNRAQAAMISMGQWPAGYDPYKLDNELRTIITSHGGVYIDILPDLRAVPHAEQGYLPVDGHPNADGHALLTKLLAKELTSGAVPALRAAKPTQTAFQ
jgi:hypothetical protein